jgi:hypothetical protein
VIAILVSSDWRNHNLHCFQTRKGNPSGLKQVKQNHKEAEMVEIIMLNTTFLFDFHASSNLFMMKRHSDAGALG